MFKPGPSVVAAKIAPRRRHEDARLSVPGKAYCRLREGTVILELATSSSSFGDQTRDSVKSPQVNVL